MFPVMLDVEGRACLVVGAGPVALRKVQSLVAEGARVTVVAPWAVPELEALAQRGAVRLEARPYRRGEADGYALVFGATDRPEVNAQVYEDARAAGVWVNVADAPELCSFQLPARLRRGELELAIASAGKAPFAVGRLRRMLEAHLGPEWGRWLAAAARFRSRVRASGSEAAAQEASYDRFFAETVDARALTVRTPTEEEAEAWVPKRDGRTGERTGASPAPGGPSAPARGGFVSLVGAGPGAPGLLTRLGWRRLLEADAVAYDRLAAPALPSDLPSRVELHCVGKESGHHPVPQEEINALLVRLAREGKRVVRFKGGDPYVFGRGGEEAEALAAAGVPFEVIPGVTAGVAVPAWAGIPVTHRREAVRVTLVTAHESATDQAPHMRWDLAAQDPHATLVGYMGVTALPTVARRLLEGGMDPTTPAAIIERGTTSGQRLVVSTLAALPDEATRAGIRPPALFVIGPTVRHADRLNWLRGFPLAGERLAVFPSGRLGSDRGPRARRGGRRSPPAAGPAGGARPRGGVALDGVRLRSPAHAETMGVEAERVAWTSDAVCWCLGRETALAARAYAWARVEQLDEASAPAQLVTRIRERRRSS